MAQPSSSRQPVAAPQKRDARPSPGKKLYLLAYNLNNTILWSMVLAKVASTALTVGPEAVAPLHGHFVMWTQTVAVLEVLHSLFGIVRAPLVSTLMQVASRIFLVWFISYPFPSVVAHPAYASMTLAWSVTEVIRYAYFVVTLAGFEVPSLTWLRFSTFFVLYPPGIASEAYLAHRAVGPSAALHPYYPYFIWVVLAIYVPGSPFMYSHMMKQRAKVMKQLNAKYGDKKTQ